jgi:GNAT superfamily N-acetyltransferase
MSIVIRKATESDFPSVFSLIMELAEFQGMPERLLNSVQQMKEEQDIFQCLVAETDSKEIVGIASYFFAYFTWVGKSLYLDDLYVKQSYRGLKIGSHLLNEIFRVAKVENCKRVRWLVSKWNADAIRLYKKIGAEIDEQALVCDVEGLSIIRLSEDGLPLTKTHSAISNIDLNQE